MLTDLTIRNLKPREKAYKVADRDGMYVVVSPTGNKSFRFDLPDRSIVYTGDTGPSASVEQLAKGADLLVSEMIDVDATVAIVHRNSPDMTAPMLQGLVRHLSTHHLTREQVGDLAARAGVKKVVITHFVPGDADEARKAGYLSRLHSRYPGPAEIADDLDRY